MRKRLMEYRKRIDALLDADAPGTDWDAAIEEHLAQTAFFQHERLIHLLVTLAFALMELASAIAAMLAPAGSVQVLAAALAVLLLVLLVPYIVHYYFLENETQKLYAQYDRMISLRESAERGGKTRPAPPI
ncbi:MAG TPA: hypothetical protein DCP91_03150 [Eggerthellaceae bacterium]|nr:hypothetical protein [Eggerthellaceae bacterium]